jgi:DNA-directed RNA polymerase subunit RPC12/RpoP
VFILREIFFRYLAPIGSLGPIEPAPRSGLYPALYLVLNFVIVWKAKYVQLCFWKKFKSTLALSVQQEALMKINQKKTLLFVVAGVVLLNLSGYFFDEDLIYLIFTVTQIVFSVGYWLYVSENRKWIDRFIDFVAILALNSVSLLLHYYMWLYIIVTTNTFPLFAFMVELLHVYVYYTFFSRTYLADFALYLHKSPIRLNVYPKQIEKTQIRCPKCNYTIDQVDPSMIEAKTKIFCPGCGEKIMKYELFEPSEAEVLAKHEAILQKLDEKSELSPHYP